MFHLIITGDPSCRVRVRMSELILVEDTRRLPKGKKMYTVYLLIDARRIQAPASDAGATRCTSSLRHAPRRSQ